MGYSNDNILKALSNVIDPDLKKDLVTLNMIRNLIIQDETTISFDLVLTTPACPLKAVLENACKNAIHHFVDKNAIINIHTTSEVTTNRNLKEEILPNVRNIIAVASGKGGVGKSTVAVNLAIALAKNGARTGLIDADIYGPSIPILLGVKNVKPLAKNVNGKNYIVPFEKYGIQFISIGFFMDPDQSLPWRGPMVSSALRQFINDTLWGELDYMIIDLPPGTGDIHLTLVSAVPITGAIIVSTPQELALADVKRAINMFNNPKINVPVLGLIENMAYFTPKDNPEKKYYIFGKDGTKNLAESKNIPLLIQIPLQEEIGITAETGNPIALEGDNIVSKIFKELSEKVAQQVSIINELKNNKKSKEPVSL